MIDFSGLSSADFLAALRRGTDCLWPLEAAVWLLERTGVWLEDPRLRQYVVGGADHEGERWAGFEVSRLRAAVEAGELGEHGEELAVLCFALSLYGDFPISLRYDCDGLSEEVVQLMGKALLIANGHAERD
ncbi:hypothetical protein OHA37_40745 (plasmid) [Streptomyces sp. NBC_00335]|uniref:hypothetical protein n=1 Tax=Streptomyces sp. NBC_00335 TaxID=2975714 RepID=UPI002E2CA3F3|nr:hypothetical protein [Streptomyces sp. NBC_00335]